MRRTARILLALDVRKPTGLTAYQVVETLDSVEVFCYHVEGFCPRNGEWITIDLLPFMRALPRLTQHIFRIISRRFFSWLRGMNLARSRK